MADSASVDVPALTTRALDTMPLADAFRMAMRRFAASVSIISASFENKRFGIAATAVCSLTVDPPALIVCVNRSASLYPALRLGKNFCVNLLDGKHKDVCEAFGRSRDGVDKFATGVWKEAECGTPVLADSYAYIRCVAESLTTYASHSIVVGRVLEVELGHSGSPLMYYDGQYRQT